MFRFEKTIGLIALAAVIIIALFIVYRKEPFTFNQNISTPDDFLNAYKTAPAPTITNTTTLVDPNDIPEVVSNYYTGNVLPTRNKIYVLDIASFFNGKAYKNFSMLVKRWPSVKYVQTNSGYVNIKAAPPEGREQIIPFQHNRIVVMDTNTQNADAYSFDCLNRAQAAFIRTLLIEDGALLNTTLASQNKQLWAQKEKASALEDLANYNHGYNTGYSLGLANSCLKNPGSSGSSSTSFDLFSTNMGYTGDGASYVGFIKSSLDVLKDI